MMAVNAFSPVIAGGRLRSGRGLRRRWASHDALPTWVRRARTAGDARALEQELAQWRRADQVPPASAETERDPTRILERGHDGERDCDSERPSRCSFHTTSTIAGPDEIQAYSQTGTVVASAGARQSSNRWRGSSARRRAARRAAQVDALPVGSDDAHVIANIGG